MIDQAVLTVIWLFAILIVMLIYVEHRWHLCVSVLLVLFAIPASDRHLFPVHEDPLALYMILTVDLPYQFGDWRIDIQPECCYIYPQYRG